MTLTNGLCSFLLKGTVNLSLRKAKPVVTSAAAFETGYSFSVKTIALNHRTLWSPLGSTNEMNQTPEGYMGLSGRFDESVLHPSQKCS